MFWSNFKKLCAEKGEAPNVVAAKCGVKSTGTVTGWKNGAMPSPKTLSKIADYFGVTVAELTGEGQKEKPTTQEGDELTTVKQELWDYLSTASDEEAQAVLNLLKVRAAKRPKER